jgi:predicted dehydrogenase
MIETAPQRSRRSDRPSRPRLGFAGVGWIGRSRLEAIADSEVAEISAIADTTPTALIAAAAHAPDAAAVETFDELLALDLDGVVIATPNALHATQTIAALRAGCAVFCQKPLARNAGETQLVLEAAAAADRLLGVDLSYRHTAGMQAIKRLIAAGELGDIYAVELVFHNAYGPDKPWFYDRAMAGGGCLLDLGVHLVDLALWCLDFPVVTHATGQLLAQGQPWRDGGAVEDYAAGQLATSTGTSIQLTCSWHAPAGCDARIGATFFGTKGGAGFRNVDGSFLDFVAEHFLPDRSRRPLAAPPDEWGGRAAVAWAHQLAASRAFDPAARHLQCVADTLDRLYGRDL